MKRIYKNAFKQEKLREICEQGASTVLPVSKLIFKISFRRFGPVKVENEIKKPIGANRRRLNLSNSTVHDHTKRDLIMKKTKYIIQVIPFTIFSNFKEFNI